MNGLPLVASHHEIVLEADREQELEIIVCSDNAW